MKHYIGVDVSKWYLDIYDGQHSIRIENTATAIAEWITHLTSHPITLVVCEASGGYEQRLATQLHQANIPTLVEQPNKIRAFGKSKGLRAKTDAADAQLIFTYASTLQPHVKEYVLSDEMNGVKALLKRRDQLIEDRNRETTRLDKECTPDVKQSIESHRDFLTQQITLLEEKLKHAAKQPAVAQDVALLTSIPGIGQQTALRVLTHLPEINGLSGKSLAALVGVAPFNRDSGHYQGKRFTQGGRKTLRKALYMAAVAAVRWNPPLQCFYQRLRSKGKPAKLALVATVNKLLAVIRSVYQRRLPWVENLPVSV